MFKYFSKIQENQNLELAETIVLIAKHIIHKHNKTYKILKPKKLMTNQHVYFFDGKTLQKENLRFHEEEQGIIGFFSHTNYNIVVFYPTNKTEFHHPTKIGYEYQNHGFQEFLIEKTDAKWAGGKIGKYFFSQNNLYFRISNENEKYHFSRLHQRIINNCSINDIIELRWATSHPLIEKEVEHLNIRNQVIKELESKQKPNPNT